LRRAGAITEGDPVRITKIISGIVVILSLIVFLFLPSSLLPLFGRGDFVAHWSASYMLARGEDYIDPGQIAKVENAFTTWQGDYAILARNPPWEFVLLMPYAFVPFDRAAWWWVLSNISLGFAGAVLLWRLDTPRHSVQQQSWIAVLILFIFSPTSTLLILGNVDFLVLIGLVGFLYLMEKQHDGLAGAVLVLATIKPQVVYVTLPILLLDLIWHRRWRVLTGFSIVLGGLTAIALVLRPTIISEFLSATINGNLLGWQVPTLGGVLELLWGWSASKLMACIVLPLAILFWWRNRMNVDTRRIVDVTLLVSLITTPFCWSYDFTILIIPLLSIVAWLVEGNRTKSQFWILTGVLVAANFAMFLTRIIVDNEVYFFWVPIIIALIYEYTLTVQNHRNFVYE
jgi:hypothetical protein